MDYFSKERLHHNVSYLGNHKETAVAKWDAREQCFRYISMGYCQPVMVVLKHPSDGGTFKPIAELSGQGDDNITMNGVG